MAIVGTAFVRLRVISDTLKKDLTAAVKDAVNQGSPDIESAGKNVGAEMSKGISEKISTDARTEMERVADDIGTALGDAMGKNLNKGLGVKLVSAMSGIWNGLKSASSSGIHAVGNVFSGFGSIFKKAKQDADDGGGGLSGFFKTWWSNVQATFDSGKNKITASISKMKTSLKKQFKDFSLSDFMVPLIAGLVTFLPSLLSGAGAVIGSFAATAVTALASIGPALAGGALAGIAVLGSLKLSVGLLKIALSGTGPAVKAFKNQWTDLETAIAKPIQSTLFPQLTSAMNSLRAVLPQLTPELAGFGTAAGGVAKQLASAVTSGDGLVNLKTILRENNVFITQAGSGVTGFAKALLTLMANLQPIYNLLGPMIQRWGQWAATTIQAKDASGQLQMFVQRVADALQAAVTTAANFGSGVVNVFKAAFGASTGMTTNLLVISQRFKEWTGDTANQQKMLAFFEKARTLTDQVLGILGKITSAGAHALGGFNPDGVSKGLTTLQSLGKPIAQMFDAIKKSAGGAGLQAFTNFAKVITQLAQSGVIGGLAKSFSDFFLILSKLLALPGVPQILALAAGLATMAKVVKLLWTVLGPVVSVLKFLGSALLVVIDIFGFIPVAIVAVIAGLVYFFGFTKTGRKIVEDAWNAIKAAVSVAAHALVVAFDAVVSALKTAWQWVAKIAEDIWSAIKTAFDKVVSAVSGPVHAVWDIIKTVFTAIFNFYVTIWTAIFHVVMTILTAIWDVFKVVFNGVRAVVETVLNIIWQIWIRIFPILLLPLRVFEGLVILAWEAIRAGVEAAVNFISTVVTAVWNAIWGFLQPIIQAIWNFIVTAWNAISSAVSTAVHFIWNIIVTVWNTIWGFLQPIIQAIWNFIVTAWNAISGAINAVMSAVWGVISSVWNTIWGFIKGVLASIGSTISGVWNSIVGWVSGAMNSIWGTIKSVWNSIIGFIQGAASTISGIWSGIWNGLKTAGSDIVGGLKSAVNFFIGIVNSAIGGLNKMIGIANKLPGVDIPTIPSIPRLAKGGIVSPTGGGTLALIAEAGRPERVEPLDENGLSKRDHAILQLISASQGDVGVRVFIGDQELTQIVSTQVDRKNKDLASKLATGRKG